MIRPSKGNIFVFRKSFKKVLPACKNGNSNENPGTRSNKNGVYLWQYTQPDYSIWSSAHLLDHRRSHSVT